MDETVRERTSQRVLFLISVAAGLCLSVPSWADLALMPASRSATSLATMPESDIGGEFTPRDTQPATLGSFQININAGLLLAANGPALAAFQRAADRWESYIADSITVNINADLASLGAGIIGQASSVTLTSSYNTIRNAVFNDSLDEPDDVITQSLPTAAQYSVVIPSGFTLNGLSMTKANAKALGFSTVDAMFGANDATITFNTDFSFDYDNSDGVSAGTMDFETVAAHEIGHALGFTSDVDFIDFAIQNNLPSGSRTVFPSTLDLYRFDNDSAQDPSNAAEFTTFARSMMPGNDEIFDQIVGSFGGAPESRFSTGFFTGDGRQASHWKADELTSVLIGIMDPTLSFQQISPITLNDLRALDLIGYEINAIPEASAIVFGGAATCLAGLGTWVRRRARS